LVLLNEHKADIVMGSESHLDETINSSEILPPTYNIFRKDRTLGGGGVFIGIKNHLTAVVENLSSDCDAEFIWVKLLTQESHPVYICSFYRPPNCDMDPLLSLNESLKAIADKESNSPVIILGGDFNLPHILWDNGCGQVESNPAYGLQINNTLLDIVNDFHLEQLVHESTRDDHILDLIFCTDPTRATSVSVIPGISDHEAIFFCLNMKPLWYQNSSHSVYLYNRGNFDSLRERIATFQQDSLSTETYARSIETNWTDFKDMIKQAMNEFIPQKQVQSSNHIPWLNRQIKHKIKERKRLYNIARRSQTPNAWASYRKIKNEITKEIRTAHSIYQCQLFENDSNNTSKKFWKYIKSLRKDHVGVSTLSSDGKQVTDSFDKAELLNNQFHSVFTNENLTDIPTVESSSHPSPMPDISISTEGIFKLLSELDTNKSPGPDEIPSVVLKHCAAEIAPILQIIFTQSMSTGTIPSDWLTANVTPVFKKNDRSNPSNYRPISLTSVCCKVMEHIIYHSVMEHLQQHQILNQHQYGFRQGYSCEAQLVSVVEDISHNLDQQKQIDLIFLDFCKAFDTVPHCRLLLKLSSYGIQNKTHSWIKSWLTQRVQRVIVNGSCSKWLSVKSGVPQGTVLGPLLFLIYINDIAKDLSSSLKLFADDCLLYREISCDEDVAALQRDLNTLSNWSQIWQMRFNVLKCVTLKCYRIRNPILTDYFINTQRLQSVKQHPYLGIAFDQTMSFIPHINNMTSRATKTLNFVKRNLCNCSQQTKSRAYTSLVRPMLEYASSVWDPHHNNHIASIKKIQRRAVRWIFNDYDYSHSVTAMLQSLTWPTLQHRRRRMRLTLLYKCINGLIALKIPNYFTPINTNTRIHHHRSYNFSHVRTDAYINNFFPRTIREWNDLPPQIIDSNSLDLFQEQLDFYFNM